jgi:AraC-like DNA-binding protein
MNKSNAIPLSRTAVFLPFVDAARQIGAPVEKMLQAAGLPTLLADDPELLLPELRCWRFIEDVNRKEGVADFGLMAASTQPVQDISTLTPLIAGCGNLYDLLKRFCAVAPLQAYTGVYALQERGDLLWFSQIGEQLLAEDIQVQLFDVLGMIQLVQLAAGSAWRPTEIHFTFGHQQVVEAAAELQPSRIRYHQAYPSISIPCHLLPLPLPALNGDLEAAAAGPGEPAELAPLPGSIDESIRQAIIPYLGSSRLNKSFAAELAGLSPRTLQRRLSEQGTSFSKLLNQTRLARAATLLKETDEKLVDISLMLSYENASTFTRAFRQWTGVSPREFRMGTVYGVKKTAR